MTELFLLLSFLVKMSDQAIASGGCLVFTEPAFHMHSLSVIAANQSSQAVVLARPEVSVGCAANNSSGISQIFEHRVRKDTGL
jgi:spore coat polysaccharide biosynthesis predicted glycosyltransferase SpsG